MSYPPPSDPMQPVDPTQQYRPPAYGPPDYQQPEYQQPGYPSPGDGSPPRRSSIPLVTVIAAVAVLLCGGAATASILIAHNVATRAKEAVKPITHPVLPTKVPTLPTDLPDIPGLPGSGTKITVSYEVTGDGPAEILYTTTLGEKPKRVPDAKLPWRLTTTVEGVPLVSISAVRTSPQDGTIQCRARVDGKEVAQSNHTGAFAAVSCTKLVFR